MPGLEAVWPRHQEGLRSNPDFDHMGHAHMLLMYTLRRDGEKYTRGVHDGVNVPPLEEDLKSHYLSMLMYAKHSPGLPCG